MSSVESGFNNMPYEPSPLVARAWQQHPRCLAEVDATPMTTPPNGIDAFDEQGFFSIACRCGRKNMKLIGHPHPEAGMLCPLDVECVGCFRQAPLFDVAAHGYDAELGHGCYSMRGIGQRGDFACAQCAGVAFELFVSFSYQIEPIEDWPPEDQVRIQNLFDGFGVDARCNGCGILASPVSYECA